MRIYDVGFHTLYAENFVGILGRSSALSPAALITDDDLRAVIKG